MRPLGVVRRTTGWCDAPNLGVTSAGRPAWRPPFGSTRRSWWPTSRPRGLAEHRRGAAGRRRRRLHLGRGRSRRKAIVGGQPLSAARGTPPRSATCRSTRGDTCGCGSTGCWETEVGERALRRAGRDPLADGGRHRGRRGCGRRRRWRWSRWNRSGVARHRLAGLVNIFNPTLVVLGGAFERIHPFVGTGGRPDERSLLASRELVRVVLPRRSGSMRPPGRRRAAFEPLIADPAAAGLAAVGRLNRWLAGGGAPPHARRSATREGLDRESSLLRWPRHRR